MKSGAGDPFADEDFDDEESDDQTEDTENSATVSSEPVERTTEITTNDSELPYKYSRQNIQDGRNRANLFLRESAEDHIENLVSEMDDRFDGEDVYKIDVLEAAILAAGESSVEQELREMGYGMV